MALSLTDTALMSWTTSAVCSAAGKMIKCGNRAIWENRKRKKGAEKLDPAKALSTFWAGDADAQATSVAVSC